MITKDLVLEKLKEVIDPELNINIVDLGLIYEIEIYSSGKPRRHPRAPLPRSKSSWRENGDPTMQKNVDSRLRGNDNYDSVDVKMTLTSPGCPLSFVFEEWVRDAILKMEGVKNVTIDLVWEPAWTPERMSDEAREQLEIT